MRRLFSTLVVMAMTLGLLTGCGSSSSSNTETSSNEAVNTEAASNESTNTETSTTENTPTSETRVIIDCSGTEVEIPTRLDKVVVTNPSAVAFMTAMGLDDKIVGTHGAILNQSWVYVFDESFKYVALFGKNPNAEELISADVDHAIIKDAEYAEDLRNQGINAVCFKYKNKKGLKNKLCKCEYPQ